MIDARILLLGGGNMGSALLGGWLDNGLDPAKVTVVDPAVGPALQPLLNKGVTHRSVVPDEAFDIVLLAVKPQMMSAAVPPLKAAMQPDTMVVSIAAGTTIAAIEALLGERPVVRAMPNTPALIGRGITGAYGNASTSADNRAAATSLLEASGPVEWVDAEPLIDAITAVSGSGPAYVFHLAECMAKAGAALGLDADLAMRLARHTVAGAGELMIRSDDEPAQLRKNVTSPNGTTQAALDVLMGEERLARLMDEAMRAARDRAAQLAKG
ncbi:pyrroline-5-carboxylate reductase [Jiella sp. MQZ9-1]|uniref:Pyrroline-5-carboxylate reductase n=1 Tax=Jiella flava TaxID=2816857 RepID=A0A939G2T8_9HYPH|nr:pyrroline-5-carboxylate reductase [Jiella flava]MBO0664034.1 pyrroline-5-carboxylate reductase [Jiella flava]MCD2472606.1 pyrroline-5-carboxylate reductase [Jiella flava]